MTPAQAIEQLKKNAHSLMGLNGGLVASVSLQGDMVLVNIECVNTRHDLELLHTEKIPEQEFLTKYNNYVFQTFTL